MSIIDNPFGNRTNNYDFTKDYWHILSAQLFFVIAFLVSALDKIDHSTIRQTLKMGKFISTVGKSMLNLVKLKILVAKYSKMLMEYKNIHKLDHIPHFTIFL